MSPSFSRMEIPYYHTFVESLGYHTGKDKIIQQFPSLFGCDDNAGDAHARVRNVTHPVVVGVIPVPPWTQTRESVLWEGLMLIARYPGNAVVMLLGEVPEK